MLIVNVVVETVLIATTQIFSLLRFQMNPPVYYDIPAVMSYPVVADENRACVKFVHFRVKSLKRRAGHSINKSNEIISLNYQSCPIKISKEFLLPFICSGFIAMVIFSIFIQEKSLCH